MKTRINMAVATVVFTGAVFFLASSGSLVAQQRTLVGKVGSSTKWKSGWMDLAPPADFSKGDTLRMTIGGSARRILVRLLPKGESPDTETGIVGEPLLVPSNRTIDVRLAEDRRRIVQISVHGGPKAWDYDLGQGNGPATLKSVVVVPGNP